MDLAFCLVSLSYCSKSLRILFQLASKFIVCFWFGNWTFWLFMHVTIFSMLSIHIYQFNLNIWLFHLLLVLLIIQDENPCCSGRTIQDLTNKILYFLRLCWYGESHSTLRCLIHNVLNVICVSLSAEQGLLHSVVSCREEKIALCFLN